MALMFTRELPYRRPKPGQPVLEDSAGTAPDEDAEAAGDVGEDDAGEAEGSSLPTEV